MYSFINAKRKSSLSTKTLEEILDENPSIIEDFKPINKNTDRQYIIDHFKTNRKLSYRGITLVCHDCTKENSNLINKSDISSTY